MAQMAPYSKLEQKDRIRVQPFQRESLSMIIARAQTENVQKIAKQNLEKGERWHKKLSIKEIVFGFQDNSIAILAMLAGVTGRFTPTWSDIVGWSSCRYCRRDLCGYRRLHLFKIGIRVL